MKQLFLISVLFCSLFQVSCNDSSTLEKALISSLVLWYDKPAVKWTEALPVGNGRLGAMVYGGTEKEIIQFNEETLWTGQPHNYANEGAFQKLPEIRKLLWEGKQVEAQELGNKEFMSLPLGQFNYQPFGNLLLDFPGHKNATNFKRKLDLENGVASVNYEAEDVKFKREVFASAPDQALVTYVEASKDDALNFTIGLNSPHSNYNVKVDGDEIILSGKANDYSLKEQKKINGIEPTVYPESKLTFEARLLVTHEGGSLVQEGETINVIKAKNVTLKLVGATSFIDYSDISASPSKRCELHLTRIKEKSYEALKKEHIQDYKNLFDRVHLNLGESEISSRPTNERLISFMQDEDPNLVALLFNYGRYLLISSSRKGTQPANLQGIWNDQLTPPWDSKYTININTEMNYWLAEITNLSELTEPLTQMVEDLANTGQSVAKEHYNQSGWVAHHNTDLWRGAAPINNANHGIWVSGGAWLSQHLWWHYQFTNDKVFLEKRAYPILKEASKFFAGYLVPHPENPEWLVSGPSNSPEIGGLVMGPTMDHQIIRNLFANTIEAAEILEVDEGFIEMIRKIRAKIAPNMIGKHGQLQEWVADMDDPENKHRHVSHLWGLHPGNEIHPLITPELAEACKVTLSHRGDGGTGWSRAWKINFWSRLMDGDHAYLLLKNLMVPAFSSTSEKENGGLYMNLFDAHPPFQIDGNFGATSGITEMLLQSHLRDENGDYFQDILPALPGAFDMGGITGIKGRGGFEFSIEWENSKLVSVEIKSILGEKLNIRYNGKLISRETTKGETYSFKASNFI